jgi:hypothetical protein
MKRAVVLISVAVLFLSCVGGVAVLSAIQENLGGIPTKEKSDVYIDPGVVLPESYVRAIVGEVDVRVYLSPDKYPTWAAKSVEKGRYNFWLPRQAGPNLAAFSAIEYQEYALRQLMRCDLSSGPCNFDTASLPIDSNTFSEMAADPSIKRADNPSDAFYPYIFTDFAKAALAEQRMVAEKGFDTVAKVAVSGDASVVGVATANAVGNAVLLIIVVVLIVLAIWVIKKMFAPTPANSYSNYANYSGYDQ